jgi:4-diphosphocytidyl-2-C-methyl-D-erythritol kinase
VSAPAGERLRLGKAPAKINLYLEVLGRRPDGFHELVTVLQTIDLCDDLTVELRERRGEIAPGAPDVTLQLTAPSSDQRLDISTSADSIPTDLDNLAVRAADRLLTSSGAAGDIGVSLQLAKRIPVGGGLGGGSSDAALTLRLLAELLGSPCSRDEMQSLAADLGSDVPFFLTGGTALCTGRGEIVEPLSGPQPFEIVLRIPDFGLSTPTIYQALNAQPFSGPAPALSSELISSIDDALSTTLEDLFRNDLEVAAHRTEPRLASMLNQGGFHLSGSGSTLFRYCHQGGPAGTETGGQFVRAVSISR